MGQLLKGVGLLVELKSGKPSLMTRVLHLMETIRLGMRAAAYSRIHPEERHYLAFLAVEHPLTTYSHYAPAIYHPCSAS